jgi:prophage regulatory protein
MTKGDHMDTLRSKRLLRLPEVSELTSLGKSTINLWVAQGKFPKPVALSRTIKVWRETDVHQWVSRICGDSVDESAPHMPREQDRCAP